MQRYSTDQFDYHHKRFQMEASSLGLKPGEVPREFEMISARTGAVLKFRYHSEKCNPACDPSYWTYHSDELPDVGRQIAVIFND